MKTACILLLTIFVFRLSAEESGDSSVTHASELTKMMEHQDHSFEMLQENLNHRFDEMQNKIDDVSHAAKSLKMDFSSKLIAAMANLGNDVSEQSKDFLKRMDVLEGGLRQRLRNIATRMNKCPSDYIGNAHGCYKFYIGHNCWMEARRRCRKDGAHLVAIETESEMNALQTLIRMNGFTDNWFWLGGSDSANEGRWSWDGTGATLSYTNWRKGFPDGDKTKNCLRMTSYSYYKNKWDDQPCTHCFRDFICEMKKPGMKMN